jgi:hypothetical protein
MQIVLNGAASAIEAFPWKQEPLMKTEANCTRHTLAEGELCKVDHCDCGMVHVALGPFTVRLEPGALHSIHGTLTQALSHLTPSGKGHLRLVTGNDRLQ